VNIVILGPGAIGSLYAYHLDQAGHSVSVWGSRHDQYHEFSLDNQSSISLVNRSLSHLEQCELLIITLKAWQVETAITPLLDALANDTIILFLHNGMGCVDLVAEQLQGHPILLGTSTHGALKRDRHHIKHTGRGQTLIGAWNQQGERCQFVSDVMHHAFAECGWTNNIQSALWQKLAINCAINPLTALHRCRNGDLGTPHFEAELSAIISEVHQVMQAERIDLPLAALTETVQAVLKATAANFSSMQQDIEHQRKSEIEFITGYVLKIAKHHHIEVPNNQRLYCAIKDIESSWSNHE
jgi:2-dehydropantoate 2-reductase